MPTYFKLTVRGVPSSLLDRVSELCFEHGSTGASEALPYRQPNLAYDPEILHSAHHDQDYFFAESPSRELLNSLDEIKIGWSINEEHEKDWLAEWKKGFEPFCLVNPYWVVPSWKESPVKPEHTISIDPGMAFGTGTHATTRMMSYLLYKYLSVNKGKDIRVLDVGTGTGILAMLARKEGAQEVIGIEIDPEARRVARENIKNNNLDRIEVVDFPIEELEDEYECVIANIIDGVLLKLKPYLLKNLKPGGELLLSGILLDNEDEFIENFLKDTHLKIIQRIQDSEWVAYRLS